MIGGIFGDSLDRHVHVEQDRALAVVAYHRLDPEERGNARAARDGADIMKARRRIKDTRTHFKRRQDDRRRPMGEDVTSCA